MVNNITQEEMAAYFGISQAFITQIETGKRNFGAYWMSFRNEARDAGVMADNGKGILEITIQRKVTV